MFILIAAVEGEAGLARTKLNSVVVTLVVVLVGFYVSHVLASILRVAGARDRVRGWSYLAGVLVAIAVFASPLRP